MKRKLLSFLLAWMVSVLTVWSQNRTVTGLVTDGSAPIVGATVAVKGSTTGTTTDENGNFSLSIPITGATLRFRYLGMTTKEVVFDQNSPTTGLNIVLVKDPLMLDEVRVTAIGEQKSLRKIGYSTSQVEGKAVAGSGESGVIQGLSGKVSNVAITKNNGDPGSGGFIQIRGQSTIKGNLQPLIVIDGVPMSNSSLASSAVQGTSQEGIDGVAQQSRLNDINPEDIGSVEVLKGAAAAAVWGTRASNGVIIVTTKKGQKSSKKNNLSVEVSSSLALDFVNREFTKQSKYGQGSGGKWVANAGGSFGDKIANRSGADSLNMAGAKFVAEDGTVYNTILKKGDNKVYNTANRDQVFRTGITFNNSISISSGNEKSAVYFNLSDWNQQGVLNGLSDYRRTTGRLNYSYNMSEKLKFSLNTFLSKVFSNRIQQGSNVDGLYLGYLRTAPDFDNTDYAGTYYSAAGVPVFNSQRGYRRYLGNSAPTYNNPGWTLNKQTNTSDVTHIILTPEITYEWMKKSILTVRTGYDISNDRRLTYFPFNSAGSYANGGFTDEFYKQSELSFHAYNRNAFEVNKDLNINTTVGFLYTDRSMFNLGGSASQFILNNQDRNAFINSTTVNQFPFNKIENLENNRVYAIFDFDFKEKIFLQLTAASEAASTFKGRFFYPSASMAYEFTKDVLKNNKVLSYGKLRGSAGRVGVEPPAYIWSTNYVNSSSTSGWGESLDGAQFGGSIYRSNIQGNPNITPEQKVEYEIGTDLKFLKNRFSITATYYTNTTTGAIFAVDVPASTGFTSKWDNAATISNKGFEAEINIKVIDKTKLTVGVYGNIGINRNMVDDISGVKSIFLSGFTGTSSRAVAGQPLGVFWGGKWDRDAGGNMILDANGFPTAAVAEGVIGDPNAKYRAGLGSTISWKGFDVNILFETSQGNQMWAGTNAVLNNFGITEETANEVTVNATQAGTIKNYNGQTISTLANATLNGDGSYTVRGNLKNFGNGDVLLDQSWYTGLGGGFGSVSEHFIRDASWFRFRELSIHYKIPTKIVQKVKIPGASVGFTGRNLVLWTDIDGVDPELNLTGATNGRGLDYFTNPATKSFIFSLKLNF
ncbi:MAG: SusC/RagA family TonB-linked outer membrane protein [Bacteroidia bacterium]